MKKTLNVLLLVAAGIVVIVAAILAFVSPTAKPEIEVSVNKAREGKARLKAYREEADRLGMKWQFSWNANEFEKELEAFKSKDHVEEVPEE